MGEHTARMRRIFRAQEQYGEGTPSEQATRYRLTEMMPDILDQARLNSDRVKPEVDLLVSLSGFSPMTTILAYELVEPKEVVVVSSAGTQPHSYDLIHHHIVFERRLSSWKLRHHPCDPTDPYAIYKLVKGEVDGYQGGGAKASTIIDITGGKKVMSAAAALVAWRLDLRLCYVESEYDPEMRQPVAGTERLLVLPNPTTLFGDDDMQAAVATFRSGGFAVAHERFGRLADSIPEPGRARFLRDLAGLYQTYTDFDLAGLPERIRRVRRSLEDARGLVSDQVAELTRRQLKYLDGVETAAEGELIRLLPILLLLGRHYESRGQLDFAALLYHRTIEGCFQERLRLAYGGFLCHAPDYTLLQVDREDLAARFADVQQSLGHRRASGLPLKPAFLDAAMLLHVLGDQMLDQVGMGKPKSLGHLKDLATTRNESLLAHGYTRVDSDECNTLESQALGILRVLWRLHGPGEDDLDTVCDCLGFIDDV